MGTEPLNQASCGLFPGVPGQVAGIGAVGGNRGIMRGHARGVGGCCGGGGLCVMYSLVSATGAGRESGPVWLRVGSR